MVVIYKLFIAEVKKQLALRDWKYADLAKSTGYKVGTIKAFMSGARQSSSIANRIAKSLHISLKTHYNTLSVQKSVQK